MALHRLLGTFLLFTMVLFTAACTWAEPLRLPLTLDLPLLRALIVQQAFTQPGEKAAILNQGQGCNQIILLNPQISIDRNTLRLHTKVQIKWGTPVMDSCLTPLLWEGSVVLWQRPKINAQWQLSFETINSAILDKTNKPIKAVDLLWDLVKEHVHGYLNKITINLAPPVNDMKTCLQVMFDRDHQQAAQRFFASMRPEQPALFPEGLQVNILAELDTAPSSNTDETVPEPTAQEYARVIELWQAWDAFLIFQLKQFTDTPLTEDDRQILLNTMLTIRYEFTDAIGQNVISNEFIRAQFLWGWNQLAPVFRAHQYKQKKSNLLGYLAFFSANDALHILDQLGPSAGIEISEDGFRRLAALLSPEPIDRSKTTEADPKLRKALGLDPLQEGPLPTDKPIPLPTLDNLEDPSSSLWLLPWDKLAELFSPPQAMAIEATQAAQEEIKSWTAELTPAEILMPKVRDLLQIAASKHTNRIPQPVSGDDWFEKMIIASAWQESCFRQFHVNNSAITYLLSSNNTSVGIMQVNEQVWRGIYNSKQLRWNISYNSQAGTEILALYLRDYLLKGKSPLDLSTKNGQRMLAAWLYALYNGGPGQRTAFLNRYNAGKLSRIEQLFLNKYDAVESGQWIDRVHCLP